MKSLLGDCGASLRPKHFLEWRWVFSCPRRHFSRVRRTRAQHPERLSLQAGVCFTNRTNGQKTNDQVSWLNFDSVHWAPIWASFPGSWYISCSVFCVLKHTGVRSLVQKQRKELWRFDAKRPPRRHSLPFMLCGKSLILPYYDGQGGKPDFWSYWQTIKTHRCSV